VRQEEHAETYDHLKELPEFLQAPGWLWGAAIAAVLLGLGAGWFSDTKVPAQTAARSIFFAAAFVYALMSSVDFYEHFRMEKLLTGRWFGTQFVPIGETINHGITFMLIVSIFVLARPLKPPLETRDLVLLILPGLFLFFGIRDELVYHRRRSYHREDILHTVSHLSAGIMLTAYMAATLVDWERFV